MYAPDDIANAVAAPGQFHCHLDKFPSLGDESTFTAGSYREVMSNQPISPRLSQPAAEVREPGEYEPPVAAEIHVPSTEPGTYRPTSDVLDELREDRL